MLTHRRIFEDNRSMPEIRNDSIALVVSSAPYWCIKDYVHSAQIGRNQSYAKYLKDLQRVLSEYYCM